MHAGRWRSRSRGAKGLRGSSPVSVRERRLSPSFRRPRTRTGSSRGPSSSSSFGGKPDAARLLDAIGAGEGPAVRVHLLRAELHERRQEFEAAEAELEAVAAALAGPSDDPVPIDVGFTAGYLALGLGRPREARAFFRAARDEARTPSRKADALFDLSVAAAEDGALAEAEASLGGVARSLLLARREGPLPHRSRAEGLAGRPKKRRAGGARAT